jgi:hypothetical protein
MQRSGLMNTVCMLLMANLSGFFGWDENPLVKRCCHVTACQLNASLAILACTYPTNFENKRRQNDATKSVLPQYTGKRQDDYG